MSSRLHSPAIPQRHSIRWLRTPVAHGVLLLCSGLATPVWADSSRSYDIATVPPVMAASAPQEPASGPTVIEANHIEGQVDLDVTATGAAIIRQPGTVVQGETLHYSIPANEVTATGDVRIERDGNVYQGEQLQLQLDTQSGSFDNVEMELQRNGGLARAGKIEFIDGSHSIGHDMIYSTCRRADRQQGDWNPAWYIRGEKIIIDTEADEGYVENGALVFYGVPILPIPGGLGFPLSDKRRSGLLPPTFSLGTEDGFEVAVPYYFNIAPNRDATVMPTLYSNRGVDLYGQFRYLEDTYAGSLQGNFLPGDNLRDNQNRWHYIFQHAQTFPSVPERYGQFKLDMHLERVSDDNYWRDFYNFDSRNTLLSERTFSSNMQLGWKKDDWSGFIRNEKWQTLQQPDEIVPPYDKTPQLHLNYTRDDVRGFDLLLDLDHTRFRADSSLARYPDGDRSYARARASYPWVRPWGYVVPALEVNARHYSTDTAMANGKRSDSVVIPTATLDSSLVFERDTQMFSRSVRQTLEPRLFLAYTPYREQNHLPAYDSWLKDFNLSSIFSANPFSGNDRIADTRAATLGVTSRLYDNADGAELANLTFAARKQLKTRRVQLDEHDTPDSNSFSNLLLDGTVNWTPQWSTRASMQWDPEIGRTMRGVIGGSYTPGPYRSITAHYRHQRERTEQIDVGWQWPLNDLWGSQDVGKPAGQGLGPGRWYTVGRLFYSLQESRLVESIVGLEYDSCCWIGRIALHRKAIQHQPSKMDNRIMFQLEFNGLSRLGSSPVRTFTDNIPNYQLLRDRRNSSGSPF